MIACGLPPCSTTIGDAQDVASSRSTFQRSRPLRLSCAVTNDLPSWSQLTMSTSPKSTGELPSPCACLVCILPKLVFHCRSPPRLRQYSPREPKKTNNRSPSVTGELDARLPVKCPASCG